MAPYHTSASVAEGHLQAGQMMMAKTLTTEIEFSTGIDDMEVLHGDEQTDAGTLGLFTQK